MILTPTFVFVHLQKAGGSFVEKFLLDNFPNTKQIFPKHIGIHDFLQNINDERIENLPKVGCIRNPYDWYVSWWKSNSLEDTGHLFPKIFTKERKSNFKKFMKYIMNEDFGVQHDLNGYQIQCLDIGVYTYRYKKAFYSPVFTSYDSMILDEILYTETLREDLAEFLGLKGELLDTLNNMPKIHTSNHTDYRNYYDNELIDLVLHKDRLIFQEYGYDF